MKKKFKMVIWIILVLILLIFSIKLNFLKIILGIFYSLFLPGFIISYLLFSKINIIKRVNLSFLLSIAITSIIIFYSNLLGMKINFINTSLVIFFIIFISIILILIKKYLKKK